MSFLVVIMCHLKPSPLISAFGVETLIGLRTVQNRLVAADFFRNCVQSLYYPQPELFPLLVFCDGDVFDVGDEAEVVYKLPFNDHRPRSHDFFLPITDHEDVIFVPPPRHPVVTFIPCLLRYLAHGGEDAEDIQHAGFVVGALEGSDRIVFGKGGGDG